MAVSGKVIFENIPEYLQQHGLFCLWRYEVVDGRQTKVPYNPKAISRKASTTAPSTFTTLSYIPQHIDNYTGFDGIGMLVSGDIAGIDIDHCFDDNGDLTDKAREIIEAIDSYTEISPSGHGIRIFFRWTDGSGYDKVKYYIKHDDLEVYIPGMTNRFLTVTGDVIHAMDLQPRGLNQLQPILDKYMTRPVKEAAQPTQPTQPLDLSDRELIDKAMNAEGSSGKTFSSLWNGNWEGVVTKKGGTPSHSEADLALCGMLAYWTQGDFDRIDNLFRQSGLYSSKWERSDYRGKTINMAIDNCTKYYDPGYDSRNIPKDIPDYMASKPADFGKTQEGVALNWDSIINEFDAPGPESSEPVAQEADPAEATIDTEPEAIQEAEPEAAPEADAVADNSETAEYIAIRNLMDRDGIPEAWFRDYAAGHPNITIDNPETPISAYPIEQLKIIEKNWHIVKVDYTLYSNQTSVYIDTLMADEIRRFEQDGDRKTGFANLDEKAGGLYTGLYVVAAISSLGKTTFANQMADQLAAAGHDVLYFSMEQSRLEMVSKSIARLAAQTDPLHGVTSLSIRKGYLPPHVLAAAEQYKTGAGSNISIIEGNFDTTIQTIRDYIRNYVYRAGIRPIVFIDYLQILQPAETKWKSSAKDEVDAAMTQLKQTSRELSVPIIAISSVNRANYLTPIDFESLKESGSIEYTADVVWGLQLQCLDEALFSKAGEIIAKRKRVKEAKRGNPRQIKLVCLKNRYGEANFECYFDYYPAQDRFVPGKPPENKQNRGRI